MEELNKFIGKTVIKIEESDKLNKFIGKTVIKIEESDKLDKGVKITFDDGSVLECAWNNWEGTYYTT